MTENKTATFKNQSPSLLNAEIKLPRFGLGAWCIALLFVVAFNVSSRLIYMPSYGDAGFLGGLCERGENFSRWLLSSSLIVAAWEHIFSWLNATTFVRIAGASCTIGASYFLLRRYPNKSAVLFLVTCPVWVLFTRGYDEIYPFVAPAIALLLAWAFYEEPGESAPPLVGVALALLPLLYIGFLPFAVIFAIFYAFYGLRRAAIAGACALATIAVGVALLHGTDLSAFARDLKGQMNLGELSTAFGRYRGHEAPDSIYFTRAFAFSSIHLADVAWMLFFGSGISVPLLVLAGLKSHISFTRRAFLSAALLAFCTHYILFMVPKLGPRRDIDLFFAVYLVAAFLCGYALDRLPEKQRGTARAVYFTASAVACYFLIIAGLPLRF